MAEHGAALQTYIQELVKSLEDMRNKRKELEHILDKEQNDINIVTKQMKSLQEKLTHMEAQHNTHIKMKKNLEDAISEMEIGFKKILESSATLLNVAQHEVSRIEEETYRTNCKR